MSIENVVFKKIKEISARGVHPRPSVNTNELANELLLTHDNLMPWLVLLKQLRLVNFSDTEGSYIKLTLLGTVVKRDK